MKGKATYSSNSSIIVEGTVAQYSCDTGYRLSGTDTRVCENNGTVGLWSLEDPLCIGK